MINLSAPTDVARAALVPVGEGEDESVGEFVSEGGRLGVVTSTVDINGCFQAHISVRHLHFCHIPALSREL